MNKQLITFIAATALTACGSKSSPAPTTPEAAHEPAASRSDVAPAPTPAPEPAKPVEAETPKPDPEKAQADLFAVETAAYDKAKPVFEKYCASCHTNKGKKATGKKLGHFDMTTYPFGGAHTKSIGNEIRVVLAIDGNKKASMPDGKPGSVKGDDLATIKAWTEAWLAAGQAGVHAADPADKDDD